MTRTAPAVAVAVVSWNTRELLEACLRSLERDAAGGRVEVWVVDNGSTDGSVEAVRERFPEVRLIEPGRNLGYGPAVNVVASRTSGPWVAAANADVELAPGAIEALLAAGAGDPGAGAVAPKLVLPDGSVQPSIQPFPSLRLSLLRNLRIHRVSRRVAARLCLRGAWDPDRPSRVDWATGAFLVVRREAWDEVGGFDESQWMYSEDLDLCWRLHRAGWAVRFVPRAVVRHVRGAAAEQAFGDEPAQAARWTATNYAWVARRRGIGVAWALALLNLTASAARLGAAIVGETLGGRDMEAVRQRARRGLRLHRLGLRSRRTLLGRR
jgi:N-acetylglucosaminyl-diphospho-decaprenol L-rhamnosyltransferase